ncbi:hypothetical protein N7462_001272 [Penicillium macrosclerotiorum]|uniref:uncharacterized protein n=1 Tax=Penicillium macrosclerotiorum TaxID=303699 RepID=UPI0025469209|nr:uncharacterized protein N7462_001272 [Penicillium macrosclerotiorum]KAJ5691849.1 hypothetical protein N7462_001272 [Penicillium macrosclerotiorum]
MKEAVVDKATVVSIRDVKVPALKPDEVLIRVVVAGTNPKDWKVPLFLPDPSPTNQGDDIAGYVESTGEDVRQFKKGDKVAAFHEMFSLHGGFAEYAIAHADSTFHIPDKTSFEEAATIPLAAMTAALGLYQNLNLPLPWNPTNEPLPLLVYGGASAVGAFAIKLAQLSNIHPLIVVAGKGASFVETIIDRSKGDTIIDYREGVDTVRSKIEAAADGLPIHHAYDAISEKGSYLDISASLTAPATITTVLPTQEGDVIPPGIAIKRTMVMSVHQNPAPGKTIEDREFGAVFFPFLGRGLAQGWFSGHPHEVRPGGLHGLEGALKDLRAGKASAVKYVVRISETDGVEA